MTCQWLHLPPEKLPKTIPQALHALCHLKGGFCSDCPGMYSKARGALREHDQQAGHICAETCLSWHHATARGLAQHIFAGSYGDSSGNRLVDPSLYRLEKKKKNKNLLHLSKPV